MKCSNSKLNLTDVKFLSLNVCGLRSKLKQTEFLEFISMYDIIVLTETKTDELDLDLLNETFTSLGYLSHFQSRKSNTNQKSGGIALIFKETLSQYITVIDNRCECVLWFKIDKHLFSTEQDILAGAVYIPPEGTKYSNVTIFDDIDSCLIDLCNDDNSILLLGDFNAYTRCNDDFVPVNDDFVHAALMNQSDMPDSLSLPVRYSKDKHRPNNFGYRLLELCKSHSIYILNGRLGKDSGVGEFTSSESTVIDYAIGSLPLFKCVSDFYVAPFDALLSDVHNPICLTITCPVELTINPSGDKAASPPTPHCERIRPWTDARSSDFRNQLQAVNIEEINRLLDQEDASVSDINKQLASVLISSARVALGVRGQLKRDRANRSRRQRWFDEDCRSHRRDYFKAKQAVRKCNSEVNKAGLSAASKNYKKAIRKAQRKNRAAWHKELKRLRKAQPREYWKKLRTNKPNACPIDLNTFYQHFKDLNEGDTQVHEHIGEDLNIEYKCDTLNKHVTVEEIDKAIHGLKNGKAAGIDEIRNEYIKNSVPFLSNAYCKLFNKVLETGEIPEEWVIGLIHPLYKGKGNKADTDNYRGITLLSCLGKLFTSILNNRLTDFLEENQLLSENQTGFRQNHSTLDHCFVLKSLLDIFSYKKKKLYCAFIDYKKAFDSVWRKGLWSKLLQEGINGKVLRVIVNMYNNIKSCVFLNSQKSELFTSCQGVRQGENLSPLLFSLYLNDLESYLTENGCTYLPVKVDDNEDDLTNYIQLLVLLYADDTILMADSKEKLQTGLDVMLRYCDKWKLQINVNKTKVMIFHSRRNNRDKLYLNEQEIEEVQAFKYLGIEFYKTGTFHKAKKHRYDQAQKAMFSLLKTARGQELPIHVVLQLFQTMVVPVMLYGCEIWGFESADIIERLQLRFLKQLLRLNKNTMTELVYGETGFYPLSVQIQSRMIRFWTNLITNPDKLSSKIYKFLVDIHERSDFKSKWLASIKSILETCGFECVWETQRFSSCAQLCKHVTLALQKTTYIHGQTDSTAVTNVYFIETSKPLLDKKSTYHSYLTHL